ncbi:unnamed protein product [Amoebophrya sp. A25]|nr:unnamed protein product [Amoebophrya sp. A25]|eukprot:GSA25T00003304001.1
MRTFIVGSKFFRVQFTFIKFLKKKMVLPRPHQHASSFFSFPCSPSSSTTRTPELRVLLRCSLMLLLGSAASVVCGYERTLTATRPRLRLNPFGGGGANNFWYTTGASKHEKITDWSPRFPPHVDPSNPFCLPPSMMRQIREQRRKKLLAEQTKAASQAERRGAARLLKSEGGGDDGAVLEVAQQAGGRGGHKHKGKQIEDGLTSTTGLPPRDVSKASCVSHASTTSSGSTLSSCSGEGTIAGACCGPRALGQQTHGKRKKKGRTTYINFFHTGGEDSSEDEDIELVLDCSSCNVDHFNSTSTSTRSSNSRIGKKPSSTKNNAATSSSIFSSGINFMSAALGACWSETGKSEQRRRRVSSASFRNQMPRRRGRYKPAVYPVAGKDDSDSERESRPDDPVFPVPHRIEQPRQPDRSNVVLHCPPPPQGQNKSSGATPGTKKKLKLPGIKKRTVGKKVGGADEFDIAANQVHADRDRTYSGIQEKTWRGTEKTLFLRVPGYQHVEILQHAPNAYKYCGVATPPKEEEGIPPLPSRRKAVVAGQQGQIVELPQGIMNQQDLLQIGQGQAAPSRSVICDLALRPVAQESFTRTAGAGPSSGTNSARSVVNFLQVDGRNPLSVTRSIAQTGGVPSGHLDVESLSATSRPFSSGGLPSVRVSYVSPVLTSSTSLPNPVARTTITNKLY